MVHWFSFRRLWLINMYVLLCGYTRNMNDIFESFVLDGLRLGLL